MAETKRVFSAGRMNKDLDERLVPQGEYREATNIEISTSEESNSGVVQNVLGNTKRTSMSNFVTGVTGTYDLTGSLDTNSATCVCSIAAGNEDKIYYFVNSNLNTITGVELARGKDYILQYDTITETIKYVFVDIFRVNATVFAGVTSTTFFIEEYRTIIINAIERQYKRGIIKNWAVTDFIPNGDKVVIKWAKRTFPLSNEQLKEKYDK